MVGENAQPTGNVSPTTAHWGSPKRQQDLAEIVDEAGHDEPARLAGRADRFRRLQRVLDLGEVDIRVAVVHEHVQVVQRLPDGHRPATPGQVLALLSEHEVQRLIRVIERIELFDARVRMRVVTKLIDGFGKQRAAGGSRSVHKHLVEDPF